MRNIRLILIFILFSVIIFGVIYFWQRIKKEKIEYFPIYGADKGAKKKR